MKDLAALIQANVCDSLIDAGKYIDQAGSCKKAIITQGTCTLVGGEGDVKARIAQIKAQEQGDSKYDAQRIKDRVARLSGGVAIVKVGGMTDEEVKANKEKVEDAINATKAAFKSGVVRGAGLELADIETSSKILNKALKAPAAELRNNVGLHFEITENIKDPADVLIAALESAVSIASLLASTKGIFTSYVEPTNKVKGVSSNSKENIAARKADIERRRQEELEHRQRYSPCRP